MSVLTKKELLENLEIKRTTVQALKSKEYSEVLEYLDYAMPLFQQKLAENIKNGVNYIKVTTGDKSFSYYKRDIVNENVWFQRRFKKVSKILCAYWTMLGYDCEIEGTVLTISV